MEENLSTLPSLRSPGTTPARFLTFSQLRRGQWLLLFTTAAFTTIGLMLGAIQVPLYKVQASIEVQSPVQGIPTSTEDVKNAAPVESYVETQARIVQSRSLLERTLAKFSNSERDRLLQSPRLWWRSRTYEQKLDAIRGHLLASTSPRGNIIDISYLSPDPIAGAHLLNSLTQELADYTVERSWRVVQHKREWTNRQLDDLRRRWEQSEQELAEASRISAPPASLQPADNANLRLLRTRLVKLNKDLVQWRSLYGSSSPEVAKLQSEIRSTSAAIRLQVKPIPVQAAPTPPQANRDRLLAHLNVLKEEEDSNRQIYEATAARLQEANFSSAAHIGDVTVVDPAIPEIKPEPANQLLHGLLGALTGLFLGIAFIALGERLASTFTDPSLLGSYLGLEVLGSIPQTPASVKQDTAIPALHLALNDDVDTAEAYRFIRSSLFFKAGQTPAMRRLVFVSANGSEGKTTVVGNLGAALASARRRILLIDGNLRDPGLHKVFNTSNERGLTDLLTRQIGDGLAGSRDLIRETQVPGLYLLAAGKAGTNAPEILSSPQLPQLMADLAKGFDFVLIDTPALLPYTDVRLLSRAADAVVLIVRAGVTNRDLALLARDTLRRDTATILGSILTDWDKSKPAFA